MDRLKKLPFHPFLFCVYIILFVYAQNLSEVSLSMTYRAFFISLFLAFFLFGTFYLIFKNIYKAGLFSTLILLGLFGYGAIYNKIEVLYYMGLFPLLNIHRYLFLFYLAFYVLFFWRILRSEKRFHKSNYFLNVFLLVLISINFGTIIRHSYTKSAKPENEVKNPFISYYGNGLSTTPIKHKPDIYYIILDGYGSNDVLKKLYDFDNSDFTNFLKSKGFYVADKSQTNYAYTTQSLASSLNLSYIDSVQRKNCTPEELINQNFVSYFLKLKGYKIVNVESGYAITKYFHFADKIIKHNGINEFERSLMELTILRLDDLLGISTYLTLKGVIRGMFEMKEESSPKFCFAHLVAPHPPYVFKKDGGFNGGKSLGHAMWEPKNGYIDQLSYVNTVMKKYITHILRNSEIKPIIIIQGDHGPWLKSKSEADIYAGRTGILNAYLVPDLVRSKLYNNISPVNTFRTVFNSLFEETFEPLENVSPSHQVIMRLRK